MNYMITRDQLWDQRKKVLSDRQKVEERLQDIIEEREKLSSTLHALSGAIQTIDYFMSKTEEAPDKKVDDELPESDE